MTRLCTNSLLAGLLVLLANPARSSAAAPDFQEVYDLIRAHAAGVSAAELNRAAVQGLLAALGPNVSLVPAAPDTNTPAAAPPLSRTDVFEGNVAYLRVGRVDDGLANDVRAAWRRLDATNRLIGVVLDLRYADGAGYAAAAAAADLFVTKAEPLLNWGDGMVSSHAKTNAIRVPVAVLVNHQTARAAEALAAILREAGAGLLLGSQTAGQAMIAQDYPLKNGEQLRIGTRPVTLGNGKALSPGGVKPDIDVSVSPADERAYYANAFAVLPKRNLLAGTRASSGNRTGATNAAARPVRLNEAELVREHNEGLSRDTEIDTPPPLRPERPKPVVTDPALARALDLIKGLAVVRQDRF